MPRWTTTDDPTTAPRTSSSYKACPCVILFHSQGGQFGFKAAQARPEKIKALVAVEPAAVGDPDKAAALKDIPILMLYGDDIEQDARGPVPREARRRRL